MIRAKFCVTLFALGFIAFAALAIADEPAANPAAPPDAQMKLPPGWTAEDMQACMIAAIPGKNQAYLAKDIGEWKGKCTMWMSPDAQPLTSDCSSIVTSVMDGRFIKIEMNGEMPGMGSMNGIGYSGYDNVMQQFVSTWIDNHSTGIMNGVGDLSADGKTLTWKYNFSCPLTKKPAVMRQVETNVDANTKKIEMFGADPKSGKEFKMMALEYSRK